MAINAILVQNFPQFINEELGHVLFEFDKHPYIFAISLRFCRRYLLVRSKPTGQKIFSFALITRMSKRRYRTKYLLKAKGHFCTCISSSGSSVTSFALAKLLGSIARYNSSKKKRYIFLAKILEHSLSVREICFGSEI